MENDIEGLKAFELLKKSIEIENEKNSNEIIDEGINLNNINSLSQIKNMKPTNNLLINARKHVVKCRIINMKKKLIFEEEKKIQKQIKEEEEEQNEKQQMQKKIKLILNENDNNNNFFQTEIENNKINKDKIKIIRKKKSLITINPKQQAYDNFVNECLNRLEEEKKFNQKYNKENNEMIKKFMNDNRNCIIKKIMKYKNDVPYENILNEIVYDLRILCEQFIPKNFINDKKIKKIKNKIFLPPIQNQKQNSTFDVQKKYNDNNNNNILFNNDNIYNSINNNRSNYVRIKMNKPNVNNNNNNNYNENDFKLNSDIIPKKSKKILFISLNKKNIKNTNNNNYNSNNDTTNSKSVNTIPIELINNN